MTDPTSRALSRGALSPVSASPVPSGRQLGWLGALFVGLVACDSGGETPTCPANDPGCSSTNSGAAGASGSGATGGTGGSIGVAGSSGVIDPGAAGSTGSTGSGIFCSPGGSATQCAPGTTCCSSNSQCSEIGSSCPL